MKRRLALRFLLFIGATALAVVMVLRTPWAGNELCTSAANVLGRLLGQEVVLERCQVEPLSSRVRIEGIRLGDGPEPLFTARGMVIDFTPLSLGGLVSVERIQLDDPFVHLHLQGDGDEKEAEPSDGRCLAILDKVKIGRIDVRNGGSFLTLPDGSMIEARGLDVEVQRAPRRYGAEIHLGGAVYSKGDLRIPVDGLDARVELEPAREHLIVDGFEVRGPGIRLSSAGAIATLCDPSFDLRSRIEVGLEPLLSLLAPSLEEVGGTAEIEVDLLGRPQSLEANVAIDAKKLALDGYAVGDLSARLHYGGGTLELETLEWPIGDGLATVRGEVRLEGDWPVRVDVKTERLEFHRLLTHLSIQNTPVRMAVDSEHRLEGHLLGGVLLEGESSLTLRHFDVRNVPWHREKGTVIVEIPGVATLDTRVRLTSSDIFLDDARAGFGNGTLLFFHSRLGFSTDGGMDIRVRSPHFDLAHVRSHVAGIPLAGKGEMAAVVTGPYPDPMIVGDIDLEQTGLYSARMGRIRSHVKSRPSEGTLDFEEVQGEKGTTAYDAEVRLVLGGDPHLDGRVSFREGGHLTDVFAATRDLVAPLAWLEDNVSGTITSATAVVRGPLPDIEGEAVIEARGTRLLDRPFDTLSAQIRLPDIGRLVFDRVEAERGGGVASAQGLILMPRGREPVFDVAVSADSLPLGDLLGSFGEWAGLKGGVSARGAIVGPLDRIDIHGEVYADHVSAAGVPLEPSWLSLETQGDEVVLRGPVAGAGILSGAVGLRQGIPFDAALAIDVEDISRFLPPDFVVGGAVRGSASARGLLSSITEARGEIALGRLALSLAGYGIQSEAPVRISYDGPSFVLEPLRLTGENTSISFSGEKHQEGKLDLQARGVFDARILDTLLPQIEHSTGQVEIQAAVTGQADKPILVGAASISRGAFRVKALPIAVQRLNGRMTFSQNQVLVEEASLLLNQGRSQIRGTVSLKDWAPDVFDLILTGERIHWRKPADWPATVSGRVQLGGHWPASLLLHGELEVDRLRYSRDLDLEKAILDFRQRVTEPPAPDDVERIRLDLDLIGGNDMRIENNLMRARLAFVAPPGGARGRLKLVGTNVRLGLLGAVEVLEGRAFFRGNEYRISHGAVDFNKRTRIDPEFDVTLDTSIREYRVWVHAFGKLDDGKGGMGYQLELSSEPMLAQADVITLLTFGITSKDLDRGGNAATGAGMAAEALLTVSGLDEHVKRWLPESQLLMAPEFSVTSFYSEATGQVEPMATFEARLLTDQLRLQAAAPFSTSRGRRASAVYRMNQTVSTQLLWENEETGYSAGDLGLDVKLRWEWE